MKFHINTMNGSGMKYNTKEDFLKEIGLMIDDCIANGGTYFSAEVDADASCFYNDEDEDENCKANLYLETEELLYFDMKTGNIKVDKSIFDDFVANTYVNICFVDDKRENRVAQYVMISEDDEGIVMEYIGEAD